LGAGAALRRPYILHLVHTRGRDADRAVQALSILHIGEFFVLSYLLSRALLSEKMSPKSALVLSVIITTIYGISDEFHQLFVPGRTFDYVDMSFNFIGAALAALLVFKTRKMR
jgi:VanZ family protein